MNQKNEKNYTQDIEAIMLRFKMLEQIISMFKSKIGHSLANENEIIPKLHHGITNKHPSIYIDNVEPYDMSVMNEGKITTHNINGNAYFLDSTGIPGLNQHVENSSLYISMAPEKVVYPISILTEPDKSVGKLQALKVLNRVANIHPNKTITLMVLGNIREGENTLFYKHLEFLGEYQEDNTGTLIPKIPFNNEELKADINFYTVDMPGLEVSLNSASINTLYDIYKSTLGNIKDNGELAPNPLIIQSTDGLNRAPKLAFAFDVMHNFDKNFHSDDLYTIIDNLEKAFNNLRKSRSPVALSTVLEFEQALYLAFALKIRELEENCVDDIQNLLNRKQADPKFKASADLIQDLLMEINTKANYSDKARLIKTKTYLEPLLSTHPKFNFIRSKPEHYELLKRLKNCFEKRDTIEDILQQKKCMLQKIEESEHEVNFSI